jgi:hypothetical protein
LHRYPRSHLINAIQSMQEHSAGAKARVRFVAFAARLNSLRKKGVLFAALCPSIAF